MSEKWTQTLAELLALQRKVLRKLNEALGLFKYERVSIIILFIFAVVVLVDALSEAIRRRLK